ncbi:hypothetical protein Hanom_Chr16g01467541 [Helianthus anomalus]
MTTAVEELVVSTVVSQPTTTFQFPSQAIFIPISNSSTKISSPKSFYTRKRKFQMNDDDIPTPTPISSSPFIQTNPEPFIPPPSPTSNPLFQPQTLEGQDPSRTIPLAVNYPLELHALKAEMRQFYIEDDPSKRTFLSLHGFRTPKNMDDYLKLKAKKAEYIAKQESKGKGDTNLSSRMQHGLSKVRKLEDYARDLSKEMSNLPPNAELQKKLRKDLLKLIMSDKPYLAKEHQFNDWPLTSLKDEANRIERTKNNPQMKKSAPSWNRFKKSSAELTLEYKRKKAELVAAKYGSAKAISRWSRHYVDKIYDKLEKLRETNPTAPKKPVYKEKTTDKPEQ